MADRPFNLRDWQARAAVEGRLKVIVVPIRDQSTVRDRDGVEIWTGFMGWQTVEWVLDNPGACAKSCLPPLTVGDRYWGREAHRGCRECGYLNFRADGQSHCASCDATLTQWDPSIWLTRASSRITIAPTSIRVCQVQDVTEEEARAAGATKRPKCSGYQNTYDGWSMDWSKVGALSRWALHGKDGEPAPLAESDISLGTPRFALANQWNIDHGVDFWERNPWVAVATADVHRRNIDSMEA